MTAALIRLAAANGDLYIDEIWSWWFVQQVVRRFVDIFAIRHDNNHLLNTMIISGLGSNVPDMLYRLPAVLASIGTVWLAGRIAERQGGPSANWIASVIVGGAYLLILYGSEARGYAYAIFFAFLSWDYLQRTAETGHWRNACFFSVGCCLGFLSHLTFVYCYAGFCVWTVWTWRRKPTVALSAAHGLPLLTALWMQFVFIGGVFSPRMAIGGGPESNLLSAVVSTLSLTVGGPLIGDGSLLAASLALLLIGVGLVSLWQTDRRTVVSYLVTTLIAPALVLAATGHALIYPRYFLVPVGFAMLVMGHGLSKWFNRGRTGRIGVIAVLGLLLAMNGWWTVQLLNAGRGGYSAALLWLETQVPAGPIVVSSDHDFRNGMIFQYYSAKLRGDNSRWQYVEQATVPAQGTPWVILHDFEGDRPFPEVVTDRYGNSYQQQRVFRHASLSGYNWWLYRRVKAE